MQAAFNLRRDAPPLPHLQGTTHYLYNAMSTVSYLSHYRVLLCYSLSISRAVPHFVAAQTEIRTLNVQGRNYVARNPAPPEEPGFEEKMAILTSLHEQDMRHAGGARGLARALKTFTTTWALRKDDCEIFVLNCNHCIRQGKGSGLKPCAAQEGDFTLLD
jgi:hypothetical protein